MSNDRELLELAAKAAGIRILDTPGNSAQHAGLYCWLNKTRKRWNPLVDDGDALRLAVKLGICLEFTDCADNAPVIYAGLAHERRDWPMRACFPDPYRETRLAIVIAAAEIGRSTP